MPIYSAILTGGTLADIASAAGFNAVANAHTTDNKYAKEIGKNALVLESSGSGVIQSYCRQNTRKTLENSRR